MRLEQSKKCGAPHCREGNFHLAFPTRFNAKRLMFTLVSFMFFSSRISRASSFEIGRFNEAKFTAIRLPTECVVILHAFLFVFGTKKRFVEI